MENVSQGFGDAEARKGVEKASSGGWTAGEMGYWQSVQVELERSAAVEGDGCWEGEIGWE
jgi:hypothetical protein